MKNTSLEEQFDNAMMNIYHRASSEAKYKAHIFFKMLIEHKGIGTAKKLVHSPKVSSGYTALWELGRLDLTVEALIIEHPIWHDLFSKEELNICHKRLCDYKYKPVINQ